MLPWCSYNLVGHGITWLHTSARSLHFLHHLGPAISGVSSMELRELEHSPQLWHNSKLSISVATIVTYNQELVATTNNKLTGL